MKNLTLVVLLMFLLGLSACASWGPHFVSKKVYDSSRDEIAAENRADEEGSKTRQTDEKLARERAEHRQKVALAEIDSALPESHTEKATDEVTSPHNYNKVRTEPAQEKSTKKTTPVKPNKSVIGPKGIIGGFPCVFINNSYRKKTLMITKLSGIRRGQSWYLEIPGKRDANHVNFKSKKLETGSYRVRWTVDGYERTYPEPESRIVDTFVVSTNPKFWYDKAQKNYHGGYILTGR